MLLFIKDKKANIGHRNIYCSLSVRACYKHVFEDEKWRIIRSILGTLEDEFERYILEDETSFHEFDLILFYLCFSTLLGTYFKT